MKVQVNRSAVGPYVKKRTFYLPKWQISDMDVIVRRVSQKRPKLDAVVVWWGQEGSGKSTNSFQCASYVSSELSLKFDLSNVFFDPNKLYDAVMSGKYPRGTVFVYDEAVSGLLAQLSGSKEGIKLQVMFSTCRSKGYVLFVNIPRLHKLPEWLAVDRSLWAYETWIRLGKDSKGLLTYKVGFVKAYSFKAKELYYGLRKSQYPGRAFKMKASTAPDTFTAWMPWREDDYEEYKLEELRRAEKASVRGSKSMERAEMWRSRCMRACLAWREDFGVPYRDMAVIIGLADVSYFRQRLKMEERLMVEEKK